MVKKLLFGIAASMGFLIFQKSMNLKTFAKAFDYEVKIKNFRFHTLTEIRFDILLTVLNPSNIALKIQHPFVQVFYENTQLMRSTYNIPEIAIKANGSSQLPKMEFRLNLISNWGTIKNMLSKIFSGVSLSNAFQARKLLEKNKAAFLKLLRLQFTGQLEGTPFTKSYNLG